MPGGRRPLGPANGGATEGWGKVILRIKEDLRYELCLFVLFVCLFRLRHTGPFGPFHAYVFVYV